MAAPVLAAIAKASILAAADESHRKRMTTIFGIILSPVLVVILLIMGMFSGMTEHNQNAVRTVFENGKLPEKTPEEYRAFIVGMQNSFNRIGNVIDEVTGMIEEGEIDRMMVKSIFYSLFYDYEGLPVSLSVIQEFVDCFVKYEERTREETDDDGNTTEETYLVAVPLTSQTEIYSNIRSRLRAVNDIDQANAIEIYYRMVYGVGAPTEGDGFVEWSEWNGTLSPEAYEAICSDLSEGEAGSLAVQLAMTRLGDPYSQAKRGQGDYTDCSYLTLWAYRQLGVCLPGTAAEQAQYCVERGLVVTRASLVPGDLIFWSHKPNGRYMNITHVGMYAGNGMVVDASSSRGKVVYRNLFDADKQVLYGRPALLSTAGKSEQENYRNEHKPI